MKRHRDQCDSDTSAALYRCAVVLASLFLFIDASTVLVSAAAAPAADGIPRTTSTRPTTSTRRVLVQYVDGLGRQKILQMLGPSVILDTTPSRGGIIIADILESSSTTSGTSTEATSLLHRLEHSPHVKQIEYDFPASFRSVPNIIPSNRERNGGRSGGARRGIRSRNLEETLTPAIKMVQADQVDLGDSIPLVCNADSGYALGHPDLPKLPEVDGTNMILPNGRELRWYEDGTGHGTATAGVIAAIEGNDIGYRGVAPGLKLFITRALDHNGKSDVSQLMAAIEQCVESGAEIISMSLGCPCTDMEHCREKGCYSELMREYFKSLNVRGILVFSAAGNEGTIDEPFFPGSYESVISVGGANKGWTKFEDSSVHKQVELAALGHEVETTFVQGDDAPWTSNSFTYTKKTGTSIAVPAVAASAALLWSHFPECSNSQIRTALARTAWNPNGCDKELGFGIVQVKKAHDLLQNRGCELDGQIFSGAANVCDSYVTLSPTTAPTETMMPTSRPTAAPTLPKPPPPPPPPPRAFEWWIVLVLVVGAGMLGVGLYLLLAKAVLPRYSRKKSSRMTSQASGGTESRRESKRNGSKESRRTSQTSDVEGKRMTSPRNSRRKAGDVSRASGGEEFRRTSVSPNTGSGKRSSTDTSTLTRSNGSTKSSAVPQTKISAGKRLNTASQNSGGKRSSTKSQNNGGKRSSTLLQNKGSKR
mmetsp:Transcript_21274/g.46387  ORF Transcript_21274/g.46387 Transcript_21274/m.46387 type:complete len:707 (-) Transcript_21274:31-2151(-)|eukprot:CAMPEP_0178505076 /NCGR_PEP_ID=MMETSP0696-20121128/18938_1 /TAXON_ID=265572 /ORGANISM="Extubocellulus spinifer, Strain CCMP396" /LENGTH=706 /DNA_ID=CAMNT_0020134363 /DNA_START=18 /DNA_END=2138 /DNA_ORIENTATION=+